MSLAIRKNAYYMLRREEDPPAAPSWSWDQYNVSSHTLVSLVQRYNSPEAVAKLRNAPHEVPLEDHSLLGDPDSLPYLLQLARNPQEPILHSSLRSLMVDQRLASTARLGQWMQDLRQIGDWDDEEEEGWCAPERPERVADPRLLLDVELLQQLGTAAAQQAWIDHWEGRPELRGPLEELSDSDVANFARLEPYLTVGQVLEGPRTRAWIAGLWDRRPQLALILALQQAYHAPAWLDEIVDSPSVLHFFKRFPKLHIHYRWHYRLASRMDYPRMHHQFERLIAPDPHLFTARYCHPMDRLPAMAQAIHQKDRPLIEAHLEYQLLDDPTLSWFKAHLPPQALIWLMTLNRHDYPLPQTAPPEWQRLSFSQRLELIDAPARPLRTLPAWMLDTLIEGLTRKDSETDGDDGWILFGLYHSPDIIQQLLPHLNAEQQASLQSYTRDDLHMVTEALAEAEAEEPRSVAQLEQWPEFSNGDLTLTPPVVKELRARWRRAAPAERRHLLLTVLPALDAGERNKLANWLTWSVKDNDRATQIALTPLWFYVAPHRLGPLMCDEIPDIGALHELRLQGALYLRHRDLPRWVTEALFQARWQAVRLMALYCAGFLGPEVHAGVLYCLEHGHREERKWAAWALQQSPHRDLVPPLQRLLAQEPLDRIRQEIGQALGMAQGCEDPLPLTIK